MRDIKSGCPFILFIPKTWKILSVQKITIKSNRLTSAKLQPAADFGVRKKDDQLEKELDKLKAACFKVAQTTHWDMKPVDVDLI